MTKYVVTIEHELNEKPGVSHETVEALHIEAGKDWIMFHGPGQSGGTNNVVAAFPTERVISVLKESE